MATRKSFSIWWFVMMICFAFFSKNKIHPLTPYKSLPLPPQFWEFSWFLTLLTHILSIPLPSTLRVAKFGRHVASGRITSKAKVVLSSALLDTPRVGSCCVVFHSYGANSSINQFFSLNFYKNFLIKRVDSFWLGLLQKNIKMILNKFSIVSTININLTWAVAKEQNILWI